MVKILNGEILQDDDPRLHQQHRRPAGPPANSSSGGGGGPPRARPPFQGAPPRPRGAANAGGFSLDAPPLRMQPSAEGGPLPDFEFFGVRVPGLHLAAVAGAGVFMGWRGALLGTLIGALALRLVGSQGGWVGGWLGGVLDGVLEIDAAGRYQHLLRAQHATLTRLINSHPI